MSRQSNSQRVFVCNCNPDKPILSAVVELVVARLEENGIPCWNLDQGLESGEESVSARAAIDRAIRGSGVFLPVSFGGEEGAGAEAQRQMQYALEREIPVIPFRLGPVAAKAEPEPPVGGGNAWVKELDLFLEERLNVLVQRVRAVTGSFSAAPDESRAGPSVPGTPRASHLPRPARPVREHADLEGLASFAGKSDASASSEFREEPIPEGPAREVAVNTPREPRGRVSFPLPPPTVRVTSEPGRSDGIPSKQFRGPKDEAAPGAADGKVAEEFKSDRQRVEESGGSERVTSRRTKGRRGSRGRRSDSPRGAEAGDGDAKPHPAIPRFAPWLSMVIIVLAVGLGLQKRTPAAGGTAVDSSAADLELLGLSLSFFARDHGGRFPASLEELEAFESAAGFVAPFGRRPKVEYGRYRYFSGHTWDEEPASMVGASSKPARDGRRLVLLSDSTLALWVDERFQEASR